MFCGKLCSKFGLIKVFNFLYQCSTSYFLHSSSKSRLIDFPRMLSQTIELCTCCTTHTIILFLQPLHDLTRNYLATLVKFQFLTLASCFVQNSTNAKPLCGPVPTIFFGNLSAFISPKVLKKMELFNKT